MADSVDGSISQEDIDSLLSDIETEEETESKTKVQETEKGMEESLDIFDDSSLGMDLADTKQSAKGVGSPKKSQVHKFVESSAEGIENMALLLDVKVELSAEIGRSKMRIDEILGLGSGAIVELDKLNGEPVDITVNNKLIARGEIVAIDGNFGVKIVSIIDVAERLKFEL